MTNTRRALLSGIALPALLTACGGDNAAAPPPVASPPPPVVAVPLVERFGSTFLNLFARDANAGEAVEPAAGAVPALDVTAEPFPG